MRAKNGDTVRVHYTGFLDDGTVFDSSARNGEPLEATLGEGMLIPGFERALLGMEPGGRLTVRIEPGAAYGEPRADLMLAVGRDSFPPQLTPEVGLALQVGTGQGDLDVTVAAVTDTEIVLDANHPLAGRALTFELELVAIL
jgi:peptidylprolyl isomerase